MDEISWASRLTPEAALLAGVLAAAEDALPGKGLDLLVWGAASRGDHTTLRYLLENGGNATWTPSKQAIDDDVLDDEAADDDLLGCMRIPSFSGNMGAGLNPSVLNSDETSIVTTSLSVAAAKGNAGVVDVLLKAGVDVDTIAVYGATPLLMAAEEGHNDIVEKLLTAGADVDKASTDIGMTPLISAVVHENTDIVEQLLESGADANKERKSDGSTPVIIACLKGLEDVVHQLIQAGADVNKARTDDGTTPLLVAAEKGNERLVESLLRCGADPNKARTTDDGLTPLSMAAFNGNERAVQLLIKAGARIVTESGESALPLAAREGHMGVCALLLKAGTNVNNASKMTGLSPLNEAVRHDQRATALFLHDQHGASSAAGIVDKPTRQKLAKWVVQEMMENVETIETRKDKKANLQRRRATAPNLRERRRSFYYIN